MAYSQKQGLPLIRNQHVILHSVPAIGVFLTFFGLGVVVYFNPVQDQLSRAIFVAFVSVGWFFCLLLHEAGHAIFASYAGEATLDDTIRMNFIKFKNPISSLLLPMLTMLFLGYGMPGGLDYLDENVLYRSSRIQRLLISVGGILSSSFISFFFVFPLWFGWDPVSQSANWLFYGLGSIVYLLVFSIGVNLIPIPPLDMFSVIYAQLPSNMRSYCQRYLMHRWISLMLYAVVVFGIWEMSSYAQGVMEILLGVFLVNPSVVSPGMNELYLINK